MTGVNEALAAWPLHHLVDALVAFTLLEAVLLAAWHRYRGRGVAPREFGFNLASGLCLMLALRQALAGGAALSVAGWLMLAGALHAWDLWRRWR